MLEGVLAGVIERLAGKYVDGIDKKAAGLCALNTTPSPPSACRNPQTL